MDISRRQFIAGASASLIVPSFAERVLAYVETFGEPLLEHSPVTNCIWHALPSEDRSEYILIDTSIPFTREPPDMTWRRFLTISRGPIESWLEELETDWNLTPDQLDDPADRAYTQIWWAAAGGPCARTYQRLTDLAPRLGSSLITRGSELGYVALVSGPSPGSWDQFVDVSGGAGLSCLQHRLNKLRTGIRIEIAPQGLY